MTEEKQILHENYDMLVLNIKVRNVVDHLIARSVLSPEDAEAIQSGQTEKQKARR